MTHESHNVAIGAVSGIPSWFTALLFISQQEVPLWLYILTAVVLPFALVFVGKAIDIGYQEWRRKRGL